MTRRLICAWLCALLLLLCAPFAGAELESGRNVQLAVCGKLVALDASTGYICRDGSATYIPVETVARALGYAVRYNADGTGIAIDAPDGEVTAVVGYAYARLNGEDLPLEAATSTAGGKLMADYHILSYLGAEVALYPLTDAMREMGYTGPAMVINRAGESLDAPPITGDSFAATLEAAKTADQIVAVQYYEGSLATLTFHEKVDGEWRQMLSCDAIVGVNGIGKTVEDDQKTPRGTYDLTVAFGLLEDPGASLPYVQLTKDDYWCRTPESPFYNRMARAGVDDFVPSPADEQLRAGKKCYNYAVAIGYNADCVPGKGSAIFLHCTGGLTATTGGIAVSEDVMRALLQSLEPGAKIVIF